MVIGIEGNVHVGKTTYIKNNFSKLNIIKETEFKQNLKDYDRQLYYIENEVEKKKQIFGDTVLDRTIISTIIYTIYTDSLTSSEKKKLIDIIKNKIRNNKIIIPSFVYLILYPYKLISLNHTKLVQEKRTQNILIDYNYYLKYSLFFSNFYFSINSILITKDYRQIISYNSDIFKNIFNYKTSNSKILLDGCPAIGKSTIGSIQKKYDYIKEFKYKKYTLNDYSNQIESIVDRVNILNKDNILLDTSFLMGITHLFYNRPTTAELRLEMIDKIMGNIPLNHYITRIFYLVLDKEKLVERKNMDSAKNRKHFYDNLNYLEMEINFYKVLHKRLGVMSNISFIDASRNIDELVYIIENNNDKPLMLIDLFYEIKEAIKEGEL